jgi:hypothetical protein
MIWEGFEFLHVGVERRVIIFCKSLAERFVGSRVWESAR